MLVIRDRIHIMLVRIAIGTPVYLIINYFPCVTSTLNSQLLCHFILEVFKYMYTNSTVKSVLYNHSKEDKKLVFKTNYRLMQVKSIAECSKRAFCI